jgi:hypothetical protein
VGLQRGKLNLVSTIEELLERKISGRRDPQRFLRNTPLSVKSLY